jgi:type IV pilus assembly protein PilB
MSDHVSDKLEKVKKRIGELLVEEGLVEQEHVDEALSIQKQDGGRTVDIMIDLGFLDSDTFERFLGNQPNTAAIGLTNYKLTEEVYKLVPAEFAIEREIFPVDKMGRMLTLGMVCPIDWRTIDEVAEMTGMKVSPFLCSATEIHHVHEQYFGHSKDGASTAE